MYNLTRKEMIEHPVSLSVIWDNDDEQWLECSEDLIIEGLDDTYEGMGEDDGYNRRIKVTYKSLGIKDKLGRMINADYGDFVEDFVGEIGSERRKEKADD